MAWLCEDCVQSGCWLLPEMLHWIKQTNEQKHTWRNFLQEIIKFNYKFILEMSSTILFSYNGHIFSILPFNYYLKVHNLISPL